MPRWVILLLLPLAACTGGPELEAEAAAAALASHQASLRAVGAANAAPRAAAPVPQAASLLGATPEAVRAALGEPLLRRAEGAAQIWLYTGGGCQLDIVLYGGDAGPLVAHVQARAGGIAQRSEASCLRDIAAQAARPRGPSPGQRIPSSQGAGAGLDA